MHGHGRSIHLHKEKDAVDDRHVLLTTEQNTLDKILHDLPMTYINGRLVHNPTRHQDKVKSPKKVENGISRVSTRWEDHDRPFSSS
ncbi:unnamed protein product [Dovyalis caffra]|uniref:Uncharacterized protein n=1 Tax=Dovyalis caffra TaxID=77055 RepID=A0AAV1SKH0_9ROSI|nr:unnamed protein product [Dovyalis caffra]